MYRIRNCLVVIVLAGCGCGEGKKSPDLPIQNAEKNTPAVQEPVLVAQTDPVKEPSELGDYVELPSVGIKVRKPVQFAEADSFDGFGIPQTNTTVMALSIPGPFSKVTEGFTREKLASRGWTLHSKQDVKINGAPAILIHFEQPAAGSVFLKWSLCLGDDKKTVMVTATFPKSEKQALSDLMRAAVLSTQRIQVVAAEPGSNLPFSVVASSKLKAAPSISKSLAFTRDGAMPAKSPKDPLFFVSPSLVTGIPKDKKAYSELRLKKTAQVKEISIQSTEPIVVDGLEGFESIARALDSDSGEPLLIYQVMLFKEGAYFVLVGMVGAMQREEFLPEFQAMAKSFQRKQQP